MPAATCSPRVSRPHAHALPVHQSLVVTFRSLVIVNRHSNATRRNRIIYWQWRLTLSGSIQAQPWRPFTVLGRQDGNRVLPVGGKPATFSVMHWGFLMAQVSQKTSKRIQPRAINNARDDKVLE